MTKKDYVLYNGLDFKYLEGTHWLKSQKGRILHIQYSSILQILIYMYEDHLTKRLLNMLIPFMELHQHLKARLRPHLCFCIIQHKHGVCTPAEPLGSPCGTK